MTIKIFLSVILGVFLGLGGNIGLYNMPSFIQDHIGQITDLGLLVLLFFVGMDIGQQKGILKTIQKMGFKIILVPLGTILGSLTGGLLASVFLSSINVFESTAIAAGLGWYTLSANILSSEGFVMLSALAFLTNVFREVLALITMPFVSKNIGYLESVAMAGATAMDTSLPLISSTTDGETAIIAFVSGVLCTCSVPIILPIIISLGLK